MCFCCGPFQLNLTYLYTCTIWCTSFKRLPTEDETPGAHNADIGVSSYPDAPVVYEQPHSVWQQPTAGAGIANIGMDQEGNQEQFAANPSIEN